MIQFHEESKTFHLYNDQISYIFKILKNNQLGQLYYGKRIHDRDNFDHLFETSPRPMSSCSYEGDLTFSLEHIKQEYPVYGSGDLRHPAIDITQENGSHILNFEYVNHQIIQGKPQLDHLPATYVEKEDEAQTLIITLYDDVIDTKLQLSYTIYHDLPVITRNAFIINCGQQSLRLNQMMSMSLDLPDQDYEMIELCGSWSRERSIKTRKLVEGIQSIYSLRGCSSHQFNPFIALKRKNCNECAGEVLGFSFVYSGNFLAQVEVDNYHVSRVLMGIHPHGFEYVLNHLDSFQTPEVVMVYSNQGLGDWFPNLDKLPHGIRGLSKRIHDLGLKFGLWFEPEMVNEDSNLYRNHPEWILKTPHRKSCHGRNQYILDFSNHEVVEYIAQAMMNVIDDSYISYIKWDMNRCMSEVYSSTHDVSSQGRVMHEYILGVYHLYDVLTTKYPDILFESCASGGARFDPGMLYYAPQCWTSDDTDAIERLKIQYGTSLVYPLSSMGSHVSAIPNHQTFRNTPLETRANVAYFGTFGYELDVNQLTFEEKEIIKKQISFMKQYRSLFQFGTFYRLKSPFTSNETAWMVVSHDKTQAIVGYYRPLQEVNVGYRRLPLLGLDEDKMYHVNGLDLYGDELMNVGLIISDSSCGENKDGIGDYYSKLYILKERKENE